ncbi:hypothetical protein [Acidovorax sp.]|uniref:hypothetical protein n=1 Tax=Acidovorax sp. TaxID=1872122 RepID=UPI002ACE0E13|nr:hypothetical protein [Acidovorax sp.]MDZ7862942.1 hypothetical protein [Acidovorax sp.]
MSRKTAAYLRQPAVQIACLMLFALAHPAILFDDRQPVLAWVSAWAIPMAFALSACALHAALRQGRSPAAWPGRFAAVAWVMMVLSMVLSMVWPWTEQWSQRLQGA